MNSRTKGHNFERKWATFFKTIGYKLCMTARLGSRLLDNCKLDLINIPYNVQLKHDKRKLPYDEIFRDMNTGLLNNLPKDSPIPHYPKVIIHRLGRKRYQEFAVMPIDDFKKILVILGKIDELERKG